MPACDLETLARGSGRLCVWGLLWSYCCNFAFREPCRFYLVSCNGTGKFHRCSLGRMMTTICLLAFGFHVMTMLPAKRNSLTTRQLGLTTGCRPDGFQLFALSDGTPHGFQAGDTRLRRQLFHAVHTIRASISVHRIVRRWQS